MRGPREAVLLARLVVVAAMVPVVMRLRLSTAAGLLAPGGRARKGRRREADVDRLVACFDRARVVGYPFVRPGCLTRAVTLFWFLSRCGMPVELVFGIDAANGDATGHAWLALEGVPFLEPDDPSRRFTPTYRVGGAGG